MDVLIDLLPILLIGAVMYVLIIRPQLQEQAQHDELLKSLAKDDRVVTSGGIHGRIVRVDEDTVVLEIGDKSKVTLDKKKVARRQGEPTSDKK